MIILALVPDSTPFSNEAKVPGHAAQRWLDHPPGVKSVGLGQSLYSSVSWKLKMMDFHTFFDVKTWSTWRYMIYNILYHREIIENIYKIYILWFTIVYFCEIFATPSTWRSILRPLQTLTSAGSNTSLRFRLRMGSFYIIWTGTVGKVWANFMRFHKTSFYFLIFHEWISMIFQAVERMPFPSKKLLVGFCWVSAPKWQMHPYHLPKSPQMMMMMMMMMTTTTMTRMMTMMTTMRMTRVWEMTKQVRDYHSDSALVPMDTFCWSQTL